MLSTRVSSKNQISIPSEARRRLGIRPGDQLTVTIHGDTLVLRRQRARASDRLRGIGRGMYPPDPLTFVRGIRDELEAQAHRTVALDANDN